MFEAPSKSPWSHPCLAILFLLSVLICKVEVRATVVTRIKLIELCKVLGHSQHWISGDGQVKYWLMDFMSQKVRNWVWVVRRNLESLKWRWNSMLQNYMKSQRKARQTEKVRSPGIKSSGWREGEGIHTSKWLKFENLCLFWAFMLLLENSTKWLMKRSIQMEMCVQWAQSRAYLEITLVIPRKHESVRASSHVIHYILLS